MNTLCNNFIISQLEKLGKEGKGECDLQMGEERREKQTKLWISCTRGKDGELKPPK